ncbi:MAG: hypothetical protein NUV93_01035 [Firmicutes bacterium]|jgi:hypothetical protein|nr:hypothetical protein [Bacillota bacterium]
MTLSTVWPLAAIVLLAFSIILVPRHRWIELIPSAVLGGFVLSYIVHIIGGTILGLWTYSNMSLPVLGMPLWLAVAFGAEVIMFLHFLPESPGTRLVYVILFSAALGLGDYGLVRFGLKAFHRWNAYYSALLFVAIHYVVVFIDSYLRQQQRARAK